MATTLRKTAAGPRPSSKPTTADPANISSRLYNQLDKLLDDMEAADRDETMTFPQRIAALIAVGRVMKMFADLRKADLHVGSGSEVAKYATAFKATDAARVGANNAGFGELDSEPDDDDRDDA